MKKSVLTILSIFFVALAAKSQTIEQNGIKYTVDTTSKTASASFADAEMTDAVVVPMVTYDNVEYQVTSLADRAFFGCRGLKTIKLPATVKSVGTFAFLGCDLLERVDIPSLNDWLAIKFADGFSNPLINAHDLYIDNVLLTNLVLPEGMTEVSNFAFTGASITSITLSSTLTEIGSHAFYECTSLQTFSSGQSLKTIGIQAFDGCSALSEVILGSSVTDVKGYAFNQCPSLKTVTFGPNVSNVGTDAFAGCDALEAVNISDIASWCRIDFANAGANPLAKAHVLLIDGKEVTDLVIPSGITEIKEGAFSGCTAIERVILGSDVTKIETKAFNSCPALKSVAFAGPVTSIGDYAFEGCPQLADLHLPSTLTTIGDYALYGTSLKNVEIPAGLTVLPDGVFGECEQLSEVSFPEGVTSIGFGCFYGCTELTEIVLPASLKKIGKSAFNGCSKLKTIHLGEGIESISAFGFGSCRALTDIYVNAVEPPVAPESVFSAYTATLHVPQNSVSAYKDDSTWGKFTDIRGIESGSADIISDSDITLNGRTVSFSDPMREVEILTVEGRLIYKGIATTVTLSPGFYVFRILNRTIKIKI